MAKIAFKSDNQGQFQLLPPSLDELIPATHPVRVLNSIVTVSMWVKCSRVIKEVVTAVFILV